ncbi:hypothetical protein [Paracandidimonas soli]|uniref:hypothetical protein n=1 Tax=Paracandidimonas soli TaxID=1917182 RepID=UPI0014047897|nr:hypothetical protein [Paracandidimonas soli]
MPTAVEFWSAAVHPATSMAATVIPVLRMITTPFAIEKALYVAGLSWWRKRWPAGLLMQHLSKYNSRRRKRSAKAYNAFLNQLQQDRRFDDAPPYNQFDHGIGIEHWHVIRPDPERARGA